MSGSRAAESGDEALTTGRRSRDPNDSGTVPVDDDVDFIAGLETQIAPDLLGDGDLS